MEVMRAIEFDGSGHAAEVAMPDGVPVLPDHGFLWVQLLGEPEAVDGWLVRAGLDPLSVAALTVEEARPRCTVHEGNILMNLRGVNLSPGAEPEDMVSIRFYLSDRLVVSLQRRRLYAVQDTQGEAITGSAADSPGELVARIALRLADRAEPVVMALNERIDDLEDAVLDETDTPARADLANIRRMAIMLRRFMAPQRDALSTLDIEEAGWLHRSSRGRLREATERMTRLSEELDSIRDRAQVVRDQIVDMRAEAMNRQMLVLSVVAALFLPLGLITGLLGINVGGIPGEEVGWAFWAVCGLLLVAAAGQLWLFRRMGMIGRK
ncbi:zinc transporter ZntB [Aquicoccus sp. G2-2]|uniref:zinc transporter ZntB n=1 Tax=Aquicoccus sp. G2-2 TaxID=3092120 RepID=UPI002AE010D7|nr:zinc transporter ZntB [Aquicoccus sp. G2-2]MEA1113830.1 zinc transporter ZntB [Aquicoccus sp. G2-2]